MGKMKEEKLDEQQASADGVICTSCETVIDIELAKEDDDSNYFCGECYEVLAPIMQEEFDEQKKIEECYKTGEACKYNCHGQCKESC